MNSYSALQKSAATRSPSFWAVYQLNSHSETHVIGFVFSQETSNSSLCSAKIKEEPDKGKTPSLFTTDTTVLRVSSHMNTVEGEHKQRFIVILQTRSTTDNSRTKNIFMKILFTRS